MSAEAAVNLLASLLPFAVGRGNDPDSGSGVLIIVLVIVGAIVVIGTILTLVHKRTRG